MAGAAYIVGTVVTLLCGILLLRRYRISKNRLLLWSGLCFLGLALNNLLIFADLVVFLQLDLYRWRLMAAAGGTLLLLYGLIWEAGQ